MPKHICLAATLVFGASLAPAQAKFTDWSTVKALATEFEVTGTVRNLSDGRVELTAEGMKDELKAFQQAIRESELGHFIRAEEVSWSEATGNLRGFEISR